MKRTSSPSRSSAFAFIDLLVLLAIIAILAAILLPSLARAKAKAQRIQCVNNLKQVGLAFRIWSVDHGDKYPMGHSTRGTMEWVDGGNAFRHFQALSNELASTKILACPADTRPPASGFAGLHNHNLSYFVGLDADETRPQMLLAGDRNITNNLAPVRSVLTLPPESPAGWTAAIHIGQGNVGLSDGSVQQFSTPRLRDMLKNTGDPTNRIALPD